MHAKDIHLDDIASLELGLGLAGQRSHVTDGVVDRQARGEGEALHQYKNAAGKHLLG